MSSSDVRLVVSVQARGFVDKPWEGHLATGLLVAPDEVLVPSAPVELAEATEGLDLLVLPLPLGGGDRVERLVVEQVLMASTLPGDAGDRLAVLRFGNASRHEPQVSRFGGTELDEAVRTHDGDLWMALETIGAITPGVRDALTPDLLREAAVIEDAQRAPLFEHRSLSSGPAPLCPVIKVCAPPRS